MSNLYFDQESKVLVQGATGKEGQRAVDFMKNYFTNVVAGVTPGKGGQVVLGTPIFNSIKDAIDKVGQVQVSTIYVPPANTLNAVEEAIKNKVSLIHILTEGIPYRDIWHIIELCRKNNVDLLGPGSLGLIVTGCGRIGMLGGPDPQNIYKPGHVSIISRSGGMANEIANYLSRNSVGIRSAFHIGAEIMLGLRLSDIANTLNEDENTESVLIFEEFTHNGLKDLVDFTHRAMLKKNFVVCVAGRSCKSMPRGAAFGHIDNLLEKDNIDTDTLLAELESAGFHVVDSYEKFIDKI